MNDLRTSFALLVGAVLLSALVCLATLPVLASSAGAGGHSGAAYLLPDLVPVSVKPVMSLGTVSPDKLWVEVKNQGQAPVSNYGMQFQWDQGTINQQQFFLFQSSLGPGESHWVKVDAKGYKLNMRYSQYRITLDHTHSIAEGNEGNNVYNGP